MKCQVLVASLLLLGADLGAAGDDPYGLLFTSPGQRAQLDNRFTQTVNEDGVSATGDAGSSRTARLLKLNGTLISSGGKKEVWINGERQLDGSATQTSGIRVLSTDTVKVRSSVSGVPHDMKPGQILDADTGLVSEAYANTAAGQLDQPGIE
jgi:hypothetical protein